MAYPPEIRAAVRAAYIYQRLPMCEAAGQSGVPESTGRAWQRAARALGDDWEMARAAASLTREGQLAVATAVVESFVLQFQYTLAALKSDETTPAIERAEILARLSDSYAKMMSAAGKASTPISRLSVAMDTLRALGGWIAREAPDLLQSYTEVLDRFGPTLAETLRG